LTIVTAIFLGFPQFMQDNETVPLDRPYTVISQVHSIMYIRTQ